MESWVAKSLSLSLEKNRGNDMKKAIKTELVLSELGLFKGVKYHYADGTSRLLAHSCCYNTKKESTLLTRLMNRFNVSSEQVKREIDVVEYDIECLAKELQCNNLGWLEYAKYMDDLGRLERLLKELTIEFEVKKNC